MTEFQTYIFKENEVVTHNARVKKERLYVIGIILVLIGIIFSLLDLPYTSYFMGCGFIVVLLGRIFLSGKEPSVGHRPVSLTVRRDSVLLGQEEIKITDRKAIRIRIGGYAGELFIQSSYQKHSGNDNFIHFPYNGKTAVLQFVLESKKHKEQLKEFCEENGIDL